MRKYIALHQKNLDNVFWIHIMGTMMQRNIGGPEEWKPMVQRSKTFDF